MIQINTGNSCNTSERTYDLFFCHVLQIFINMSWICMCWCPSMCFDVLLHQQWGSATEYSAIVGISASLPTRRGSILLCRWPPISIISRCQCQPRVQMDSEFCRYQVCALLFCLRKESEWYSSISALRSPTHSSVKACDFQYLCTKC